MVLHVNMPAAIHLAGWRLSATFLTPLSLSNITYPDHSLSTIILSTGLFAVAVRNGATSITIEPVIFVTTSDCQKPIGQRRVQRGQTILEACRRYHSGVASVKWR